MEYVKGETLADRLRKGAMPVDSVLRYRGPDRRRTRCCAQPGDHSPGFEAREHHDHGDWGQAAGLRAGEGQKGTGARLQ
jgi:hypothetical protein